MPDTLRIATLNCRNTKDNWLARREVLAEQLRDLSPDIIGLQELRRWPSQGKWIRDRAKDPAIGAYSLDAAWKGGWWKWAIEGIGTLSRLPVVDRSRLRLGYERVALRTTHRLPGGGELDFYTTHLHHPPRASRQRVRQVERLLAWVGLRGHVPHVLVGDLNANPGSPEIELLYGRMRSALREVHGREPDRTFPAPSSLAWHDAGSCLDYIFVSEGIALQSAAVVFDRVSAANDRVSPSDHFGLVAEIVVGG